MNTVKSKIYFTQSFGLNVRNKTVTCFNKNQISRSVAKSKRKKDANIPINKTINQHAIDGINIKIK